MDSNAGTLTRMYDCFNARDIDGVLSHLTDDVVWANGMDGGHVHGREAVRAYWSRQWAVVRASVKPVHFETADDGAIIVTVGQSVRDLDGRPLTEQAHGLHDRTLRHVFHSAAGKVLRFDIAEEAA